MTATVALVQALGDAEIAARLWCVTSGAVSTGETSEPVALAQAPSGASPAASPSTTPTPGAASPTCPPSPTRPPSTGCAPC
ncbi:hypothetical protein HFP43_19815 [Streptomyces sp. SJ1-7]|nr:hypothetical protein [Streptomyces sp. SJ1-7]